MPLPKGDVVMSHAVDLSSLATPSLILDETIMLRNIERLERRLTALKVSARPHLKTVKSVDAARRVLRNARGATVSTLREAEVFADAGVSDILYGVGISPQKLPRVLALRARGCDLVVVCSIRSNRRAPLPKRLARRVRRSPP